MKQTGTVMFGSTAISFGIEYARRKTLAIAVHPDGRVVATAPLHSAIEAIEAKVRKRSRWILRQRNFFGQFSPRTPARQYLSGETHLYLGRQYRLKVSAGEKPQVKLSRGFFLLQDITPPTPQKTAFLLDAWYREKAEELYRTIFEQQWSQTTPKRIIDKPRLHVKKMRTRWGSLSKGGILTLNSDLIRAPKACVEYVICHELCHLEHHDHSVGFYKQLTRRMPDWQKRKKRLEAALV